MTLRLGTTADIQLILSLTEKFHASSPYHDVRFDPVRAIQFITDLLNTGVIILAGEHGFIAGTVVQLPCASSMVATELAWHVLPEAGSNLVGRTLKALQEAFEYWARNVAKAEFVIAGSFHPSSFFTKRGYIPAEQVYLTRLE